MGCRSGERQPLPLRVQLAPVHALLADDFDEDGHKDLILAGNFDGVPPRRGRYDATYGWFARGDGQGGFEVIEPATSNLWLEGQTRALRRLQHADGTLLILAARNNAVTAPAGVLQNAAEVVDMGAPAVSLTVSSVAPSSR